MPYDDHSEYPRGIIHVTTGILGADTVIFSGHLRVSHIVVNNTGGTTASFTPYDVDDNQIGIIWSADANCTTVFHFGSDAFTNGLKARFDINGNNLTVTVFYWDD